MTLRLPLLVAASRVARSLTGPLVSALLALTPRAATGQTPPGQTVKQDSSATAPTRGIPSRQALEAFVDGVLTFAMRDKHVAGGTVSVVKDGALFFAKGYGFADVAKRKPVDPERTLFRIGSVSKLFTWTAVMQLVEAGKLDLDADVNTYLDFKIPDTYPEPITLRHLLTHTPGLEEDSRDLFTEDSTRIATLGAWLPAHMPKRVRPAGTFSSYSNWGSAVAGYVVERASGQRFDDYIEQRILEPLGMRQTTTRQPLPARFADAMSLGYSRQAGKYESKPWEIITGAAPAGSMSASATDMATWMLVHLGKGALGDVRILSEPVATQMTTRSFSHDSRLPGFALGFYEKSSHGLRIIGHGGDTQWFHSDLALVPEENLGIFVSFNTDAGGALSSEPFLLAFLDRFYPVARPAGKPNVDLERFAGAYLPNRMSYTTFQKAVGLFSSVTISVGDDSTLVIASSDDASRFVPIDSLLFQEQDGEGQLAFRTDAEGRVTHAFLSAAPMIALERAGALQSPSIHKVILGGGSAVFGLFIIAALARWFRRRRGVEPEPAPSLKSGRRILVAAALTNLVFLLAFAALAGNQTALLGDGPVGLTMALALPIIGLLLMLGAAWFGFKQWRGRAGSSWERVRFTATVVVGLLFAWSLSTWNLLGWQY